MIPAGVFSIAEADDKGTFLILHPTVDYERERKNPSGQSLIYGEGSNYGQQYAELPGETVGEMPVGIQTLGNYDEPYWPPANIATYREVWTTPIGRWLWIAANLLG